MQSHQLETSSINTTQLLKNIQCIKKCDSKNACFSQSYEKYAFVCENQDWECLKFHKKCTILQTKTFLNAMTNNIIPVEQFENEIAKGFDNLIDELSELRDKILLSSQENLKMLGLNKENKNFLKQIENGEFAQINGSTIWKVLHCLKPNEYIMKKLQAQTQNLALIFAQCKEQIIRKTNTIFEQIQGMKLISEQKISYMGFNKSKIIKDIEQESKIQLFFQNKKIKKVQLLYQASQNQFSLQKYWDKCLNIPHTLIVCETQSGKKIGGYTPIPWKKTSNEATVSDESRESFVFSLTHNEKLTLSDGNQALKHNYQDYGPNFGTKFSALKMCDKANEKKDSYGNIGYAYCHRNYQQGKKQAYQRFIGCTNNQYVFKAREWQVWRIEFM